MIADCAKSFGFENNQFIAVSHFDTNHQHLHIIANRIGFDKKTLPDSNNYRKIASYCREMEQKYNLQKVLSPRKFLSKELRQIPRSDSRKKSIKNDVRECITMANNYRDFKVFMKQKNYQVIKGRGIAFIDSKGVYVKGSELGYSLARIEKILELSVHQKQALLLESRQNNLVQKQAVRFKKIPGELLLKKESTSMKITRNNVIEDLLKPTLSNQNIPFQLIRKNKKSKRSQSL
jgi:hypothetical protein